MTIALILIFIVAYALIVFEHPLKLDKTVPALLGGALIWTLISVYKIPVFIEKNSAKRALFEARGEIFSVPAEHGIVRNLTESSGVAERYPAWSPDGKWIAYFSDRTGEYELTLRPADGKGAEQVQTQLGAGWRYAPQWSPDAKKIVFIDSAMRVHLHFRINLKMRNARSCIQCRSNTVYIKLQ